MIWLHFQTHAVEALFVCLSRLRSFATHARATLVTLPCGLRELALQQRDMHAMQ